MGGFAEYAVVDDRQVAPLPEGMSAVDAAVLMCAGVTIYAALKRSLRLARDITSEKAPGANVVDARLEEAAEVVARIGQQDGKQEKGDMGLDAVIALPESQPAFDYGMALLRNHGRCLVVSFPEKGFHVAARDLVFRDISVVGNLVGSNKTLREML
ncbi:hypothetical protein C8A05DRAFT_30667 [Staphylotrichum tortipilum]|uniref:Alcohol dehydrogenase-like C-terminal domain-containing protein n=1 Tax=Staphylotrichum tortipilum TaxID=2831512 RepID=A0AAN6MR00_9PEZI|nr:hypothetical protein C8A05DRAFT_30667 [Staphylotrichum longicolle]